jgi:RNA polymerase sigma-70 factor (ECF subfamily)
MRKGPDPFLPTRRSLLTRLKNWEDQESWRDFFDTYWGLIYGVAIKQGLSDAEAQDVVQETVITVWKHMPGFHYDPAIGSFKSWLLNTTRWRIADQFRKRPRHLDQVRDRPCEGADRTATIDRIPDPSVPDLEAVWEHEWEQNLADAALRRVKSRVTARQYQIFDLYVLKQWPVSKVARALGVSLGQVYLARHRIGNLVKKEARNLRARPI